MLTLLHACGGIALLLFGIRFLKKGLDRLVGERLPVWVERMTGTSVSATATGAALGLAVPSSTSVSLLSVSLVRDGILLPHRAMALVMGAFVGITLTVHLIAFNIFSHAPLFILAGVLLFQCFERDGPRAVGQIILAIGFMLSGVGILSSSASSIAGAREIPALLEWGAAAPGVLVIVGMTLTIVAQSSTATIAVLVTLGLTDPRLINESVALPLVVGANLGLSMTLLIAGWSQIESRRLGLGVLVVRVGLAAALLALLPWPVEMLQKLPVSVPWRIAIAHTAFNLLGAVLALPLLRPLGSFVALLTGPIPRLHASLHLNGWPDDPAVALAQSKREIGVLSREIMEMLDDAWDVMKTGDLQTARLIRERDDRVDRLERQLKRFLTQTIGEGLPPALDHERDRQLRFVSDLETIGDVIDRNLVDLAIKKSRKGLRFSPEGWEDLKSFFRTTNATLELASGVFVSESPDLARKLLAHKARVRDLELELREKHYDRLQTGSQQTFETTDLHLEALSQLKHINHVVCGVAYGVLQNPAAPSPPGPPDPGPPDDNATPAPDRSGASHLHPAI